MNYQNNETIKQLMEENKTYRFYRIEEYTEVRDTYFT